MKLGKIFQSISSKAGAYSVIAVTSIGCHMISYVYSIITKRYVMPYEYGIYTTVNIMLLYMNYLQLGVLNAYSRDYPQLLGAGNEDAGQHLKNSVFTFLMVIYSVSVLIIGVVITVLWQMKLINDLLFGGFFLMISLH